MQQSMPPNDPHIRPDGVSDRTIQGVGKMSEGLERIERARGALYDFHQMIGGADKMLAEAADILEDAGCKEQAARIRQDLVGRNVLPGCWSFQIIEGFNYGKNYWNRPRYNQLGDGRHAGRQAGNYR
jgi:hypothetical protein